MLRPFDSIARRLRPLGICGNAGLIVGMLTGGLLALLDLIEGPLAPSAAEAAQFWVIAALSAWLVLLFLFVALIRWTFASVALPSLVNALLVSGFTLLLCWAFGWYAWAWWIGIFVGIAVGLLLCGLYRSAVRG